MQRILIIVIVLAVVLTFMVTYVVRFNEQAVITTFGRADKSSVVTQPGLGFKWPYPFQKVTTYDKRIRLIQSEQETQQTADSKQVILATFLTWRVSDPLEFYKRFGGVGGTSENSSSEHYRAAEQILKTKLRSAASAVSRYRIDQLASPVVNGSKLTELEGAMLTTLKGSGESSLADYGIEPIFVGISGIGLPAQTSQAVFDSMKAARNKIATEYTSQGESEANKIRSEAESSAKTIEQFASTLATTIRKQGDLESAKYLAQMNQDPQLAVFLKNMEFLGSAWGRTTTLVLPTTLPGLEFLRPDASNKFGDGRPPAIDPAGALKGRVKADAAPSAPHSTLIAHAPAPESPAPKAALAGEGR